MSRSHMGPGMMAHAYNPSYLGGGDWEGHNLRAALAKSLRDPISTSKSWVYGIPLSPQLWRKAKNRIMVQAGQAKSKTLTQN
jgi:hypothetical protein